MASPVGAPVHIAGAATTDIKTSCFNAICINTPATGLITISDGTPGTTIAIINTTTSVAPVTLVFGVSIASGNLRVVSQASQDLTVVVG